MYISLQTLYNDLIERTLDGRLPAADIDRRNPGPIASYLKGCPIGLLMGPNCTEDCEGESQAIAISRIPQVQWMYIQIADIPGFIYELQGAHDIAYRLSCEATEATSGPEGPEGPVDPMDDYRWSTCIGDAEVFKQLFIDMLNNIEEFANVKMYHSDQALLPL